MKNSDLKVGQLIEGFEITSIDELSEIHNVMYQFRHLKTGALMVHLANDDDNNCFSAAFKTIPYDASGLAHILEHTVLCGSKKFPVRDPFFSMIKRSMKTFMNAFTASDWTMYPFSSQNETDFFNLMDVYLDAVFFPLLSETSFQQEGHRMEFKEHDNPESPLIFQGVVYNEMLGAMSRQSTIMHHSVREALFPTIAYKYNSGGDPEHILELTHKDLVEFHKRHYHPSNSMLYAYGNIPISKTLKAVNHTISQFDKKDLEIFIPDENRYSEPQEFSFSYQLNEAENDGKNVQMALCWLNCNIGEPLEVMSLQLISLVLLGHSGAELRKRLLESQLGKALSDITGFEDEIKETYFSVGLQGIAQEDVDKVEKLILNSLEEIADKGIEAEEIESAIHQIELGTKEITGGYYTYSLNLLFRFFGPWAHGCDPLETLRFEHTLEQLKEKISQGPFLENQIRKYLINNPHRTKVVLLPDSELEKGKNLKLENHLQKVAEQLSEEDKNVIIENAVNLKKSQDSKEDLSILPTLKISDIPPDIKYVAPFKVGMGDLDVTFYDRPTNGILYMNWYFKMEAILEEDRKWLPLAGHLLGKIGAGGLPYEKISQLINLYTGGIGASPTIESNLYDELDYNEFFSVSSKALNRNIAKMFELMETVINKRDFRETDRIQILIRQRANGMATSLVQSGHSFASSLAGRNFTPVSHIEENYSGVSQLQLMKQLAQAEGDEMLKIIEKLSGILGRIFSKEALSILVVGEKDIFPTVEPLILNFVDELEKTSEPFPEDSSTSPIDFKVSYQNEMWLTTTPVSYVAQAFKTVSFPHEDAPGLLTLSCLLRSCFLHSEIREKGGAYGGMASYNAGDGIFTMVSYRDPKLAETLSVYDSALSWIKKATFTEQDVEESILQVCSSLDTPQSPAGKAASEYASRRRGTTKGLRENFRKGILKCRKKDLIRLAETYLSTPSSIAAITGEPALERDRDLMAHKSFTEQNI